MGSSYQVLSLGELVESQRLMQGDPALIERRAEELRQAGREMLGHAVLLEEQDIARAARTAAASVNGDLRTVVRPDARLTRPSSRGERSTGPSKGWEMLPIAALPGCSLVLDWVGIICWGKADEPNGQLMRFRQAQPVFPDKTPGEFGILPTRSGNPHLAREAVANLIIRYNLPIPTDPAL